MVNRTGLVKAIIPVCRRRTPHPSPYPLLSEIENQQEAPKGIIEYQHYQCQITSPFSIYCVLLVAAPFAPFAAFVLVFNIWGTLAVPLPRASLLRPL